MKQLNCPNSHNHYNVPLHQYHLDLELMKWFTVELKLQLNFLCPTSRKLKRSSTLSAHFISSIHIKTVWMWRRLRHESSSPKRHWCREGIVFACAVTSGARDIYMYMYRAACVLRPDEVKHSGRVLRENHNINEHFLVLGNRASVLMTASACRCMAQTVRLIDWQVLTSALLRCGCIQRAKGNIICNIPAAVFWPDGV